MSGTTIITSDTMAIMIFVGWMLFLGVIAFFTTLRRNGIGSAKDKKYTEKGTMRYWDFEEIETDGKPKYHPIVIIEDKTGKRTTVTLKKIVTEYQKGTLQNTIEEIRFNPKNPAEYMPFGKKERAYRRAATIMAVICFTIFAGVAIFAAYKFMSMS